MIAKGTFHTLEWIISILIGFIVFEIMTKVVKEKIDKYFPLYKYKVLKWSVRNEISAKSKTLLRDLTNKRIALMSGFSIAMRNRISKKW